MRLATKILLAFGLLLLTVLVAVYFFAGRGAVREVRGVMMPGEMTSAGNLARELAGYYRVNDSWRGVDSLLDPGPMAGMMNQRLILLDQSGVVLADTSHELEGQIPVNLPPGNLTPIRIGGKTVGNLIVSGGLANQPEEPLLMAVNRALTLAIVTSGIVGLVIALILSQSLTSPLRQLTDAVRRFSRGERKLRLPAPGGDEVGDLNRSFQGMMTEIEKQESLRKEMTTDIAHELRTPLSVMRANLEALADGVYPLELENLLPLQDSLDLLSRLVEDLRTLALADAGRLTLDATEVDLADLLRRIAGRFSPQAEARSQKIEVNLPVPLPLLQADPQRLEQVLGNLLSNAIHITPEKGRISICAVPESGGLRITVEDSGPGIPPDQLEKVFERFYRVDSGRSRTDGGSGLGLSIARRLVEAHGGTIHAENRAEGGARLTVFLPNLHPPAENPPAHE